MKQQIPNIPGYPEASTGLFPALRPRGRFPARRERERVFRPQRSSGRRFAHEEGAVQGGFHGVGKLK